jgi:hypothetical protein
VVRLIEKDLLEMEGGQYNHVSILIQSNYLRIFLDKMHLKDCARTYSNIVLDLLSQAIKQIHIPTTAAKKETHQVSMNSHFVDTDFKTIFWIIESCLKRNSF